MQGEKKKKGRDSLFCKNKSPLLELLLCLGGEHFAHGAVVGTGALLSSGRALASSCPPLLVQKAPGWSSWAGGGTGEGDTSLRCPPSLEDWHQQAHPTQHPHVPSSFCFISFPFSS